MSNPRRFLTFGASRKRKEMERGFFSYMPSSSQTAYYPPCKPASISQPDSSNRLLAGYMAYEFLTKGTLFGQKFDPARAEAVPLVGGLSAEPKWVKPQAEPVGKKAHQSYAEVSSLMKSDGTHVPGVVNPTQLARWIYM